MNFIYSLHATHCSRTVREFSLFCPIVLQKYIFKRIFKITITIIWECFVSYLRHLGDFEKDACELNHPTGHQRSLAQHKCFMVKCSRPLRSLLVFLIRHMNRV